MPTQPMPKGYHSITPYLVVKDALRAIDYYKRAFGAKEISRTDGPNGKILHAEIKIGASMLMLMGAARRLALAWAEALP